MLEELATIFISRVLPVQGYPSISGITYAIQLVPSPPVGYLRSDCRGDYGRTPILSGPEAALKNILLHILRLYTSKINRFFWNAFQKLFITATIHFFAQSYKAAKSP